MINVLRKIYAYFPFFSHYGRIGQIFKGFNNESYHSDKRISKGRLEQVVDYLYIFFKLKYLPENYHLFGFDQKERKEFKNYIGCTTKDKYYAKKVYPLFGRDTVLIDDKITFNIICNHYQHPVPKCYGHYPDESGKTLRDIMNEGKLSRVVLKPRYGAYGSGIHFISINDLDALQEPIVKGDHIVEEVIKQHSDLDKINPHSINSIRIITLILQNGTVEFLAAMLKMSSTTLPVDNFSTGGIIVGIDMSTGTLKKEGFLKYKLSNKPAEIHADRKFDSLKNVMKDSRRLKFIKAGQVVLEHPITGFKFDKFELPFWNELKSTVAKAHKTLKAIKSIGWDIAIGPDGPILIEGNRLWGTAGIQAANGGLLTEKNRMLFKKYGIQFYN